MKTPLIGITYGLINNSIRYPELYVEKINKAGGSAVFLSPSIGASDLLENHDGFIIPGGKDINPVFYNEKQKFEFNPEKDERIIFEKSLLHEIIKSQKPVLGICYGMQLINICFNGTLYQDIGLQITDSIDHREGRHIISIDSNPYIEKGEYTVESSHHQAIKDIGKGLIPFAYTADNVIEAVCYQEHNFLLGVQWHPERTDNQLTKKIFNTFIEACCGAK